RSPSPGCAWTRARVGAMSSWRGTTSTRRSARETNTHWRWASSSAGRTTSCRGSRMRSAPGRARSRRTPPSPVCAGRSGPIRCAAPTCWRRAACASSPVESTRRCTLLSGTTPHGTSPIRCTSALTRSSRPAGLVALLLLAVYPSIRLSAQTIDTIVVVNHNIFDLQGDDAPGPLARLANRLHVTTRAGVIRRTLLVNPGDRYDSARVAESERALRSLFVFSRVRLDTTRIAGRLALRVTTSDGWSTKPQFGYSTAGGDATWLAGLVEENVFGTATALSAVYNKTPDRTILAFRHINPHFFGRRTRLAAEYASKSDGKHGVWFMGVPFFETRAARALAIDGEAASERVLVFRDGVADTVERRVLRIGVTAGFAPHATSRDFVRVWASAQWRREDFDSLGRTPFPRSTFGAGGAGPRQRAGERRGHGREPEPPPPDADPARRSRRAQATQAGRRVRPVGTAKGTARVRHPSAHRLSHGVARAGGPDPGARRVVEPGRPGGRPVLRLRGRMVPGRAGSARRQRGPGATDGADPLGARRRGRVRPGVSLRTGVDRQSLGDRCAQRR